MKIKPLQKSLFLLFIGLFLISPYQEIKAQASALSDNQNIFTEGKRDHSFNLISPEQEVNKDYLIKRGRSNLKTGKVFGYASLVALGTGAILVRSRSVGYVFVFMFCPLFGSVGTIYWIKGRRTLRKAEQFGFYEPGSNVDIKFAQHTTQLGIGLTQNGLGLTLTF